MAGFRVALIVRWAMGWPLIVRWTMGHGRNAPARASVPGKKKAPTRRGRGLKVTSRDLEGLSRRHHAIRPWRAGKGIPSKKEPRRSRGKDRHALSDGGRDRR
jgi:hypothetical protein